MIVCILRCTLRAVSTRGAILRGVKMGGMVDHLGSPQIRSKGDEPTCHLSGLPPIEAGWARLRLGWGLCMPTYPDLHLHVC